jgi:putative nucleotidyltransferase with HDIG domain
MTDYKSRGLELLEERIKNRNLIKHNLAAAALMRALAKRFEGEEAEVWEVAGLVHDLDWEETAENPMEHGRAGAEILAKEGFPEEIVRAVRRHNFMAGEEPPETMLEKALYYGEEITGLIVAAALISPEKKLSGITPENILNRFKEKAFARGVNRELLSQVPEQLGLSLEELATVALDAMREIRGELGL